MAEEPSAKRPRGETSDQSTEVDDVQVPGQKHDYKVHLKEVDIHGKEKLDVVCTSNPEEADKMISRILKRVCGLYPQYIGVDVEYPGRTNLRRGQRFYSYAWRNSVWYITSPRQQNGEPSYSFNLSMLLFN